jgi:carbonic anhydrase/acetyltransferase-like protein (isoleucine patch superfamily)
VHATADKPTRIGDDCVVGHLAHLEGCVVHDGALIGSGSIVLHDAVIRTGALVGAGALVPGRMEVPERALAVGVPATLKLDAVLPGAFADNAANYVDNGRRYREELRRLDG